MLLLWNAYAPTPAIPLVVSTPARRWDENEDLFALLCAWGGL